MKATHREARGEARRLIRLLVDLLNEGEHFGVPTRTEQRIVIPIEGSVERTEADAASMRALLAAWLDMPSDTE